MIHGGNTSLSLESRAFCFHAQLSHSESVHEVGNPQEQNNARYVRSSSVGYFIASRTIATTLLNLAANSNGCRDLNRMFGA
mmetsp:Transcript_9678/g.17441  ORF Transcript_9678/g.17441 Transcript_9678/m.17441 type:complete len:81 (-) Transcript_9678:864-1106(-)